MKLFAAPTLLAAALISAALEFGQFPRRGAVYASAWAGDCIAAVLATR